MSTNSTPSATDSNNWAPSYMGGNQGASPARVQQEENQGRNPAADTSGTNTPQPNTAATNPTPTFTNGTPSVTDPNNWAPSYMGGSQPTSPARAQTVGVGSPNTGTPSATDPNNWAPSYMGGSQPTSPARAQEEANQRGSQESGAAGIDAVTGASPSTSIPSNPVVEQAPSDFSVDGNSQGYVSAGDVLQTHLLADDLSQKGNTCKNVSSAIESFMAAARGGKLSGEGYESMLGKLDLYKEAFLKASKLSEVMSNNIYASANTYVSSYICNGNPYGDYVDYSLLESLREDLKQAEADYLDGISLVPVTVGYGNEAHTEYVQKDPAKAAAALIKIEDLTKKINFIEKLPTWDVTVIKMLESIQGECSTFANQVNSIQVSVKKA